MSMLSRKLGRSDGLITDDEIDLEQVQDCSLDVKYTYNNLSQFSLAISLTFLLTYRLN